MINREQIAEMIKEVLGEVLSLPPDQIQLTQAFWDEEVASDPTGFAEFTVELETRLGKGFYFSEDELESLTSFDVAIDWIEAKLTS